MSNFNQIEHKGNFIFRNQPNHSYFDKPFEDEHDCLFQCLNDIDPHFLKPEQQLERLKLENSTIIDPRTQKPITQLCYDYTKKEKTKIFHSPKRSIMKEEQHRLGVRVLNLLQQCLEVEEEDMYNWYRLQKMRLKENQYFQKFVFKFNQNSKEQMYAPCQKLLELYQIWYKCKARKLMVRYPQEAYNTHLGLPQVMKCKNVISDQQVIITNQKILSTVGEQCSWQENVREDLKKINYSIRSYYEAYINSEELKDCLEENLQSHFVKIAEERMTETPYFYISLESLLFLLTAGDYTDTSTEMLLNIKETENYEGGINKYIIMDIPLPSRQCGWHVYEQVVENAAVAMFSIKQQNSLEERSPKSDVFLRSPTDYKISSLENFLKTSTFTADKLCKFSRTLTKWQLSTLENNQHLQIYTSLDFFFKENISISLKLEYKPRFGCEVLTKYEILKNWFKLKLGASKVYCLRLDATNYETLLEEKLNTRKLEEQLFSVYQINCNQLLNNLFEFLKMLYNMPSGQYMLRYNPKFKDKLMLCKPSQEITQNTIQMHEILSTHATDTRLISEKGFLAIDENLCSLMHLQHQILPAAFSPRAISDKTFNKNHKFVLKQKKRVIRSRKEFKKPILNKTRRKRIRKKQRENTALKAKRDELKEIEQEIELDRKMLNL